uniref:Uncharacterized protein n=1 Tax=Cucumis melo TaxID=3656 RepID=A0A9I9E286_CUCME
MRAGDDGGRKRQRSIGWWREKSTTMVWKAYTAEVDRLVEGENDNDGGWEGENG